MIFEPAEVPRLDRPMVGPKSHGEAAKMKQSRSATSVAGEMLTGTRAPTRLSKDWDTARDIDGRGQRLTSYRTRRKSSKDGAWYTGAGPDGPFVRGPRFEKMDGSSECLSWHEQRVNSIFKELDPQGMNRVSLDKLQESFEMLNVPIDEDMFARYVRELLGEWANSASFQEFIDFHKAVWANQPAGVRHRAGCPQAFIGRNKELVSTTYTGSDPDMSTPTSDSPNPQTLPARSMSMTSSATKFADATSASLATKAGPGLADVRDAERQLRRAYRKYTASETEHLRLEQLPALFQDLGMDGRGITEVESQARKLFRAADLDGDGALSFYEFVEFQNRYLASLEAIRSSGFLDAFHTSAARVPKF